MGGPPGDRTPNRRIRFTPPRLGADLLGAQWLSIHYRWLFVDCVATCGRRCGRHDRLRVVVIYRSSYYVKRLYRKRFTLIVINDND
jgi:hypothetical protein